MCHIHTYAYSMRCETFVHPNSILYTVHVPVVYNNVLYIRETVLFITSISSSLTIVYSVLVRYFKSQIFCMYEYKLLNGTLKENCKQTFVNSHDIKCSA